MPEEPIALVFPGQGSQVPGMAAPWRGHPAFSRWSEADTLLGRDISRLGLTASSGELREPRSCQVALFVHQAVLLEAWCAVAPQPPVVVAGHSLGEYNALVAAGVLSFADAVRLVDARAQATQQAADERPGALVACLGASEDVIRKTCAAAGAHLANDNAPGQIVVAGSHGALERFTSLLPEGRAVRLDVGAAYHSPHMEPAVGPFRRALEQATFRDADVPVVANVDARAHTAAGDWPELLARQLVAPVHWRQTVAALVGLGAGVQVELCATPVLGGLAKRIDRRLARRSVQLPDDLAATQVRA